MANIEVDKRSLSNTTDNSSSNSNSNSKFDKSSSIFTAPSIMIRSKKKKKEKEKDGSSFVSEKSVVSKKKEKKKRELKVSISRGVDETSTKDIATSIATPNSTPNPSETETTLSQSVTETLNTVPHIETTFLEVTLPLPELPSVDSTLTINTFNSETKSFNYSPRRLAPGFRKMPMNFEPKINSQKEFRPFGTSSGGYSSSNTNNQNVDSNFEFTEKVREVHGDNESLPKIRSHLEVISKSLEGICCRMNALDEKINTLAFQVSSFIESQNQNCIESIAEGDIVSTANNNTALCLPDEYERLIDKSHQKLIENLKLVNLVDIVNQLEVQSKEISERTKQHQAHIQKSEMITIMELVEDKLECDKKEHYNTQSQVENMTLENRSRLDNLESSINQIRDSVVISSKKVNIMAPQFVKLVQNVQTQTKMLEIVSGIEECK